MKYPNFHSKVELVEGEKANPMAMPIFADLEIPAVNPKRKEILRWPNVLIRPETGAVQAPY